MLLPTPAEDENKPKPHTRWHALETGLLIAGSALLGGLAVAFWNRKSLSRLRQPVAVANNPSVQTDVETE